MSVTLKDVDYVAALARLRFSDDEREHLVEELNAILTYMDQLNKVDVSGVPPTSHVLDLRNVLREDEVEPSLPHDEALANAPGKDRGHFTVPKVL
jgi:aspartyl-tRNA(Asn)/glutamyl-tRNA(Gln) amidotransferase subunit C